MIRRVLPYCSFVLVTAAGCAEPESIATYKVPKKADVPDSVRKSVVEYRLLGAVIPGEGGYSFFVLMQGKADDLAPHAEAFDALIKGLKFPDGLGKNPTWTLPKGWAEDRSNANRIATLYPNGPDKNLEVTVTQFQGDLLMNVNRWRGKVGMPAVGEDELKTAAPAFKVETGQPGHKVDATGKQDPTKSTPGMGMRPGGL